jgi:hypothetical protein
VLAFVSYRQLIDPSQNAVVWAAIIIFSVLSGVAINAITIRDFQALDRHRLQVENLYRTLENRLTHPLINGLEHVLRRGAADISLPERALNYHLFAKMDGNYRIIASTLDSAALIRRISLKDDEGVIGFTVTHKASYIAHLMEGGIIYDRAWRQIGKQQPLRASNLAKVGLDLRWITTIPLFDRPDNAPWSDRVIGVLSIDCMDNKGRGIFGGSAFQGKIDSLAYAMVPYLTALQTLKERAEIGDKDKVPTSPEPGKTRYVDRGTA